MHLRIVWGTKGGGNGGRREGAGASGKTGSLAARVRRLLLTAERPSGRPCKGSLAVKLSSPGLRMLVLWGFWPLYKDSEGGRCLAAGTEA